MILGGSLLLSFVSGCSTKSPYSFYAATELNISDFGKKEGRNYHRPAAYSNLKYEGGELPSDLSSVYSVGQKRHVIDSVGRPYLTVIPVDFSDYPSSNIDPEATSHIKKAFFGDKSGNNFFSVREFYDKSSYHRLQIEGEVVNRFFRPSYTAATLSGLNNANRTGDALKRIYAEAVEWYNGLGFNRTLAEGDPIYFVYATPYATGKNRRSNMFWAFVINNPAPIGWSSYHMLNVDASGRVDAHTCIHECGHLLGLDDYYDSDFTSDPSPVSPLGRFDMMDCSLGDHGAFSKMLMRWGAPYVVDGACEITLRQSGSNPDFLLLAPEWNGTPFDEYLLLEFYSPSYLNAPDSKLEYAGGKSLINPGVKVYHVDARLGLYESRTKDPVGYFDEDSALASFSLAFHNDNSGTVSGNKVISKGDGFLIQLLDASSGSADLSEFYVASFEIASRPYNGENVSFRKALFGKGDGFCGNKFASFRFNSGKTLPYDFEVTSLTSTEAVIKVSGKA